MKIYAQSLPSSEAHKGEQKCSAQLFDMKLYAQPPPREDCPICMIPLPLDDRESRYMSCCGKFICVGCRHCLRRQQCPFCNSHTSQNTEEMNKRIRMRIEKYNDPRAMYQVGCFYSNGMGGFPVDHAKAVELFLRASELGWAAAHYSLGVSYIKGVGIEQDQKKAIHHWQQAAMMGYVSARYILGVREMKNGNLDDAMKHFMIAAKCGDDDSLNLFKPGFLDGYVTKEDFEKTLRGHQASKDETKCDQRDLAKAANRG